MASLNQNKNPKAWLTALAPVLFVWAIVMVANIFKWLPVLRRGDLPGNDDFMRLVAIRDWLNGQSWNNLEQSRLFPPDPLQSHWARLSDVIVGSCIKVLQPIFGLAGAELAALIIIPSLLLLVMLLQITAMARSISDSNWMTLTSALMAALCFPIIAQFTPGRIDHHGLQIVLALGTAYWLIRAHERAVFSAIAGWLCAISLWVGIESAPYVAAACIVAGLMWVLKHENGAKSLRLFSGSLFAGSALLLMISRPMAQWSHAVCDALSPVYVVLCAAIAAAMIICSFTNPRSLPARLALIAVLGVLSLAVTLMIYPQCLHGPYAELDPKLADIWLSNVTEAKPLLSYFTTDPVVTASMITVPILGYIALYVSVKRQGWNMAVMNNTTFRVLLIFMSINLAAAMFQIRLITFAGACAAPLGALLMASALDWSEKFTGDVKRAFIRVGIIMGLSPLAFPLMMLPFAPEKPGAALAANAQGSTDADEDEATLTISQPITCRSAQALRPLNTLPAGFAISHIDLGAPMLASTHHSVSSAPYHRNEAGNLAALDIFMKPAEQSKDIVETLGAQYVIACKVYSEATLMINLAPDGLLANLTAGDIPDWLEEVSFDAQDQSHTREHLLVYKVR